MSKENMTLQIESELKEKAEELFDELGMDMNTATGIFYRQALQYHGIPFEIKVAEPNECTYAAMKTAEQNEDIYGPYDSVSELMEALDA